MDLVNAQLLKGYLIEISCPSLAQWTREAGREREKTEGKNYFDYRSNSRKINPLSS